MNEPEFLDVGDHALAVQFGNSIDLSINARVLALDRAITAMEIPGISELVPTYRSLLIHYDPLRLSRERLRSAVVELWSSGAPEASTPEPREWLVPVCYGGDFGEDLAALAERHGLDERTVVDAHSAAVYRVYMIGFAPGFAYLGGLPQQLATPRRTEPRLWTPAGSIAIGGAQSSIASVAGPSGWHMIGRTPYGSFDPGRDPAFLFAAGDIVRFASIGPDDWDSLAGRVERGEWIPQPTKGGG